MELTRRDALAALAAAGLGGAAAVGRLDGPGASLSAADRASVLAVARTVYPGEVDGVASFVETYLATRLADDPDRRTAVRAALGTLDGYAADWFGAPFRELSPGDRARLLDQMGVDAADPDPDGRDPERVRYHLVNDLLFALFASPAGGRLVGLENPPGHPGGLASYRRGPPDG